MADESNGLFKIKAELPEANSLSTGSNVKVTVTSEHAENVMTVPVDAIYYDNGVGNVYVYQDGTVHKVEVEVGLYNTELAEIKSENGQKAGASADGGNDQPAGDAGAPKDAKNGQKQ